MAVLKNRYDILYMVKDKLVNGIVCAEVGVLRGQFSRWINKIIQPKELHLIDSWGKHLESFTDYKTFTPQHWIDIMNKVQAKLPKAKLYRMLSIEGATKFPDEYFDFIYIDADHDRCYEDLVAWYPKLKKGGIIAGHDYNWEKGVVNNVERDVRKFFKDDFDHTHESLQSWYHFKK